MKRFKPYDLGVEPSPSVPCEVLLQDGWNTFLLFEPFSSQGEVVVVECVRCAATKFGYPNDEGLPEHPHYGDGISDAKSSVLYSDDTPWLADVLNQIHGSSKRIWGARGVDTPRLSDSRYHFIFTLKEATFECIASGLKVSMTATSFDDAYAYVRRRFAEH